MARAAALAVVALALFIASALAASVATVSAGGKFDQLKSLEGGTYRYLYYVSNTAWQPASMRWDCTKNTDLCSPNTCGERGATGPQCKNPTVPSNAPYGLDLDVFPWQVRWGTPADVGDQNGVGIPSGFGFRGTYNQGLTSIYDTFWVGEAVHFNNVIYGGEADAWTMIITLIVTPSGGQPVSQDFSYRLRLDETLNACETKDGCPWTSSWWAQNPSLDTRPNCPALTDTPKLNGNGLQCCRYYTIKDYPCADRVWTLDALDQTQSLFVNGKYYTLNIKGFSIPSNPNVQKDYFISQERGKTYAEIYGNLVDACPPSCPPGQNLTVTGTSCVCTCPANTCPANQQQNSSCGCTCLPTAVNCNGGTVVTSGSTCSCSCAGVSCSGVKTLDSTNCACVCPANICTTGTVSNPSDPTCPCTCPACPTGQVSDSRCNCACPAGRQSTCEANEGIYDTGTCTCSLPCFCTNTSCQTLSSCSPADGICHYTFNDGAACDATGDLCIAKCGATGECVFDAVDCSTTVDLDQKYGVDAQCWSVGCVSATGDCVETFHEDTPCTIDLSSQGVNENCVKAVCRTTGSVKACTAIPDTSVDGVPCVLPSDDQCNGGACSNGKCLSNPKVDQPCTDGSGCTFLENYLDPITSKPSDACVLSPSDPTVAICKANRTICDSIVVQCNNVTCIDTAAGSFCQLTPLPFGSVCDDGTACTINDVCQRELYADPETGEIGWVDNGVCEGSSADCATDNPCLVGRCLEGTGCQFRTDVRENFICGISEDNCTVFRCDNGTCLSAESVCPGKTSRTGAIVGATVAGVAAILAAAAIAIYARNRIAKSQVFDPATWDQLQAGAGDNNPLYHAKTAELTNQLYQN